MKSYFTKKLAKLGFLLLVLAIGAIYSSWRLNNNKIKKKFISGKTEIGNRADKLKMGESTTAIKGTTLDEGLLRCQGKNMSFFTLSERFAKAEPKGKNLSIESCLELCYKKESPFAGITAKGSCYCHNTFKWFVTEGNCQAACSADKAAKEPSPKRILVFERIHCYEAITYQVLQQQLVGYVRNPERESTLEVNLPKATEEQCFLNCELQGKPLAVPVLRSNLCLCSDFLSLFKTLEQLRISQNFNPNSIDKKVQVYPVYKTFVDDPLCGPKKFFKPLRRPVTVLSGLPGSGNTWIRYLIESATGIYTGSVYNDTHLYNGGFIGEIENPTAYRTLTVKHHFPAVPLKPEYTQGILIVRNIKHAPLAEYTRLLSRSHTDVIDPEKFNSQDFKNMVKKSRAQWLSVARIVLKNMENVLVIYFEDVVLDAIKEVRKIVDFLRVKDLDSVELEARLMCTSLTLTGNFKRPSKNLTTEPYDEQMKKDFLQDVSQLDLLMKSYRQPPIPQSYFN